MGKGSGGGRATSNLLRLSGLIFFLVGAFHVLRYFLQIEFKVGTLEITYLGSLVIGCLLLALSVACFTNSR
ncbi:MAG: hypothetical protein HYZ87_01130 [Candidatus Omnitrophica bacterium]|nr:hypothetical protein [Candidatus Omnitrophota bacterium]